MKLPIEWVREYVDLGDATPDELAEALTMSGTNVEEVEGEGATAVLHLEITTNRPDCQGVVGNARELAALRELPLVLPAVSPEAAEGDAAWKVRIDAPELCPRYTARVVRGVKVGDSPEWLRRRLEAAGVRSISNVVDVSNYVMLEWSQPLHFFDAANLNGETIVVRRALSGESMTAIDGRAYELRTDDLVIADADGPIAIAGVMGGAESEVTASTTDVVIESATFAPVSVRDTSRRLGLASESSYRFERGVDVEGAAWASWRAATLLAEVAGGTIEPGLTDAATARSPAEPIRLRAASVRRILGIDVPLDRVRAILEGLGLNVTSRPGEMDSEALDAVPPSWRADLTREADLIEEIVRIHGFDQVPDRTALRIRRTQRTDRDRLHDHAHRFLVGAGLHEIVALSFVEPGPATDPSPWCEVDSIAVRNPVRAGEDRLRRSLVGSLVRTHDLNRQRGRDNVRLFEIASVYLPRAGVAPDERVVASLLVEDDVLAAKSLAESLMRAIGVRAEPTVIARDTSRGFFRAGHVAALALDDEVVAWVGEVDPALAREGSGRRSVAEVDLDALAAHVAAGERELVRPSRYPEIRRDVAWIVDEAVAWSTVRAAVDAASPAELRELRFFDIFRGKQLGAGRKSLAFTLVFRSEDRTLTGDEVDGWESAIVASLTEATRGERRG